MVRLITKTTVPRVRLVVFRLSASLRPCVFALKIAAFGLDAAFQLATLPP
jgi:hypothetical protein